MTGISKVRKAQIYLIKQIQGVDTVIDNGNTIEVCYKNDVEIEIDINEVEDNRIQFRVGVIKNIYNCDEDNFDKMIDFAESINILGRLKARIR